MAESQENFVANPKGKAPIWEFFRFRCKDGQVDSTKAYCTECKASVKLGGGTSNMSAHVVTLQALSSTPTNPHSSFAWSCKALAMFVDCMWSFGWRLEGGGEDHKLCNLFEWT